jgi:hypothetical protein
MARPAYVFCVRAGTVVLRRLYGRAPNPLTATLGTEVDAA